MCGFVTTSLSRPIETRPAAFSIASLLSVLAALGSFVFGAVGGLLLAVAAILLGMMGVLFAVLPNTRGGIVSVMAIFLGTAGVFAAVVKLFV